MAAQHKDEAILKEVREEYKRYVDAWSDTRKEAARDMLFVSGDPWDPKDKEFRRQANRPCMAFDELGQYINQLINDVRSNKRAIAIAPAGDGSDDESAERVENIVRGIEYVSQAQTAYWTGFQSATERSYGFWRIKPEYVSADSFLQHLKIVRIANPDSVLMDPDYKEFDGSDMNGCFVTELIPRTLFAERFPKAKKVSFTRDDETDAPDWVNEKNIMVAEYWKVKTTVENLYLVEQGKGEDPKGVPESKMTPAMKKRIAKNSRGEEQVRKAETRTIIQYLTNGIEILETNNWPGKWIPIIPCLGKELWLDKGGGTQRYLMSLIRLARDPQMAYNYARTTEAEVVGMTPKTPAVAVEGQLEGYETDWNEVNQIPKGYLYYKARTDATGEAVLTAPVRPAYEPQIQPLEISAEAYKRAIQAAMGRYNTSVGQHDTSVRTLGQAKILDQQSDQGSFHFIDNFEISLAHTGRVIVDVMPFYYDTDREVPIEKRDGTRTTMRINAPDNVDKKTQKPSPNMVSNGDGTPYGVHNVTVSTGPSHDSQRQEAQEFADTLIGNITKLPIAPPQMVKLLALAIKLKDLGPLGDAMVNIVDPQQDQPGIPPQVQQLMQKQQIQIQALVSKLQQLLQEKMGKVVEGKSKIDVATINAKRDLSVAAMKAHSQGGIAHMQATHDLTAQLLDMLNSLDMQSNDNEAALQQSQAQQQQNPAPSGAVQ